MWKIKDLLYGKGEPPLKMHMSDVKTKTTTADKEVTVHRVRIKIRAYDHKIIDTATDTIVKAAQRTGATILGPVPLPTEKRRYTVNRSTFVHKKSRDQYEMRIHKRLIDIVNPTEGTMDALMTLNLPSGVDVEIKM